MKVGTFSWRLLLGWFLILFGALLCATPPFQAAVHISGLQMTPPRPLLKGSMWSIALGTLLQFAAGIIWLNSGRRVLSKQTWQPVVGCILGYICGVFGAMTLWPDGI
jgi:hypothetical protein